ncbi:MAG: hypothetical protein IPJ04_13920 [Candidatus Eisenbacteria bacterium]|nr:hypothetical protein [Candidatus Eisenbacteria bacterium]
MPANTEIFLAMRARDEFGNPGPLSNVLHVSTLPSPHGVVTPGAVAAELRTGESVQEAFVLHNDSPGTLEWSAADARAGGQREHSRVWPDEALAKGQDGAPQGPQAEAAGGPDAFGYRWLDSTAPGGPAYAWVDIETPANAIDLVGDDALSAEVPIGFSFPYYGRRYTGVRVSTNGFLSFATAPVPFVNSGLPSTRGVSTMIAPCWDDLNFGSSTRRAYAAVVDGRFVVTWLDVPRYADPGSVQTFQAIFSPSGEICFQYRSPAPACGTTARSVSRTRRARSGSR